MKSCPAQKIESSWETSWTEKEKKNYHIDIDLQGNLNKVPDSK